jgi:hypothetical protein
MVFKEHRSRGEPHLFVNVGRFRTLPLQQITEGFGGSTCSSQGEGDYPPLAPAGLGRLRMFLFVSGDDKLRLGNLSFEAVDF